MSLPSHSQFGLIRPDSPLPTQEDFGAAGPDLDAQVAWRRFGELSLPQAYDLFASNPLSYQEDFMWMGTRAFEYYLPVIDRHLREIRTPDEWDDVAAILGSGVTMQLTLPGLVTHPRLTTRTLAELRELCGFVQTHLHHYSLTSEEQERIAKEWAEVSEKLAVYQATN